MVGEVIAWSSDVQLLAILFSEEATLNQPRNRIQPIGTRKKFLQDIQ
jgi:hypothetical protein